MSERNRMSPVLVGSCELSSRPFSNEWRLSADGIELATMRRRPSRHISTLITGAGDRFNLTPEGWGMVKALSEGRSHGEIRRLSWGGRRWSVSTPGFFCELTSDLMPRRWTMRIGGEPMGYLSGTMWSYNSLEAHTEVSTPILAVALMWHVLARPWEAASAPGALVRAEERREAWRSVG